MDYELSEKMTFKSNLYKYKYIPQSKNSSLTTHIIFKTTANYKIDIQAARCCHRLVTYFVYIFISSFAKSRAKSHWRE